MNTKALEAFDELFGPHSLTQKQRDELKAIVRNALSAPTFEDAVKIVEDFTENIGKNQKRLYAENPKNPRIQQAKYALWALDGLLTALRERGKGND